MNRSRILLAVLICAFLAVASAPAANAGCSTDGCGWYQSYGAGYGQREGDADVQIGEIYEIKTGYNFNTAWAMEFGVGLTPYMNTRNDILQSDGRKAFDNSGVDLRLEGLYHFNQAVDKVWDPFVSMGGGYYVTKDLTQSGTGIAFGAVGAGLFYNITERFFARADYRFEVTGSNPYTNNLWLGSLGWRWGLKEADAIGDEGGTQRVYFPFDSSKLDPKAQETLNYDAKVFADKPSTKITVEGHCDERGTSEYNLALGQRRADAAYKFLRGLGVAQERMTTVSYGKERPADPGHNEDAWAKNRRVQFSVK